MIGRVDGRMDGQTDGRTEAKAKSLNDPTIEIVEDDYTYTSY